MSQSQQQENQIVRNLQILLQIREYKVGAKNRSNQNLTRHNQTTTPGKLTQNCRGYVGLVYTQTSAESR
ncbi:hypothetical protein [Nodularia sp. UHCC 0506]|uniref:hypothetical protein n=1 Tax=Nodularia sp. UHCC 0506 TaxID=3110243 RepID=UPI002B2022D5|nr:hypothetical protein [Nodularia sp. UHCC 0506]MEA5516867.1 hypothetical protein [Nodularia sp. UHCC 0506]